MSAARRVTAGRPPNGGSGCHIWWHGLPAEPIVEVAATLEVLRCPGGPRVSFWALQMSFAGPTGALAAAHTGLQYNPRLPGHRAVNWGGYHEPATELRELDGTESDLAGVPGDPNTRVYPWEEGRPYRFLVHRGERGWACTVFDLVGATTVTVRELFVDADRLESPVVWAELFNHCDDPPSSVRWSSFGARTASGEWVHPVAVQVKVPALGSGGCDNLDVRPDGGDGFVITTGVTRTAPDDAFHQLST